MVKRNTAHVDLLSLFIGSSGYLVPRPYNENVKISKTMHPYLLGKRNIYYFYDIEKSLYGIRATLEVLKNIIGNGGEVLFVSDSPVFKFVFANDPNVGYLKWKRTAIAKSKDVDLVFLSDIETENLVEACRKSMLLVGVGSPTMSKMSYPFNLNIESTLLAHWFFSAIYTTCSRGNKVKENLSKKAQLSSLLGKGPIKKVKKGVISPLRSKGATNLRNEI
uniref:ribosomal protein S2 n=1 Tax=Halosiphon tomentosus TaxID=64927 RepID=UPI002E7A7CDA|nr:ribosomal protein S2 [Halosiphon tomentosus]WBP70116.1 ribosomal protein S2 [Halosiphon tomentosus]